MNRVFQSVILDNKNCKGCTNCMQRCASEAIRIRNKTAIINVDRCIDCGECIRVCPYHAQDSYTDDLSKLDNYNYNIAITPISLYGQFPESVKYNNILEGIKLLGFNDVYDEAIAADLSTIIIRNILKDRKFRRPVISSLCPAVIRLIQNRFPSLIDNIITIESPMEIAARISKKRAQDKYELSPNEIGVFYITPCPAKMTSIIKPLGIEKSYVDGAISVKEIYGDILRSSKRIKDSKRKQKATHLGVGWSKVGGQSKAVGIDNYIAVDGIDNVIKVFEEIELGKLNDIDYIEALACVGGCVGGPLNIENPYVAKSRIRKLSEVEEADVNIDEEYALKLYKKGLVCLTEEIKPNPVMVLDNDIYQALKKMEKIEEITVLLPGLDCGSCGAPTCKALAEDYVRGSADITDCKFQAESIVTEK